MLSGGGGGGEERRGEKILEKTLFFSSAGRSVLIHLCCGTQWQWSCNDLVTAVTEVH